MMLFAGCQSEIVLTPVVRYDFDFNEGPQDWEAGFANYPAGQEAFFELASDWRQLPDPLEGMGMYITGHNHSTDLFMFLKRQITGFAGTTMTREQQTELTNLVISAGSPARRRYDVDWVRTLSLEYSSSITSPSVFYPGPRLADFLGTHNYLSGCAFQWQC